MSSKVRGNITTLLWIILAALFLSYYFGIYLPNKKIGISEQQKQDQEQLVKDPAKEEQKQEIDEKWIAAFKSFPSPDEKYTGEPAEINFSYDSGPIRAYSYRTFLRDAITKGPNFAGHYRIDTAGCSTSCQILAIIDVTNGNVRFFPDQIPWTGYAGIVNVADDPNGIIYSMDSNLLILNPYENMEGDEDNQKCWREKEETCYLDKTRYFVWKNNKLSEISETEIIKRGEFFPNPDAPKFEDYPVKDIMNGAQAPLNLKSHPRGAEFKTVISEAYKEGKTFAGHYTIAEWGCGSGCQNHVIISNLTGNIMPGEFGSSFGINYEPDSRLIVVNPPEILFDDFGNDTPDYFPTKYFLLSGDGSRLIKIANKRDTAVVLDEHAGERVEWYGRVSQFSGSGSVKFFHCDIKNKKVLNDEKNPWFWGSLNDDQLKYAEENNGAVFKIVGVRNEDDCGYYAPVAGEYAPEPSTTEGVCLEDVSIEKIEVVK